MHPENQSEKFLLKRENVNAARLTVELAGYHKL